MRAILVISLFLGLPLAAFGQNPQPAPDGTEVYIITPADGTTVSSPVVIRFGLRGAGIAPAGIDQDGTGHHHLLVDVPEQDMPAMDKPLPTSERVIHFGGGQTETQLELPPGEHTLQLVFADYLHIPHVPPVMSDRITIVVE